MEFWKCFVFKVSLFFLIKIEEFSKILWSNVYIFFKKHSMIFQNSLIKSLIHKIKKIKISIIFGQLQIDEIENKMSKIIIKKNK